MVLTTSANSTTLLLMIRTRGLTHIHLIVRDMERSLHFYRTVFGMRERFRVDENLVFLNTPGSKDMITLHEDPDSADVDTAIKEVNKAGGKLLRRGEHSPGVPYAYVADPDGYVIEF